MHKQYIAMDNGQAIKLHALTFALDLVEYCQDQEIFSLTRLSIWQNKFEATLVFFAGEIFVMH